MVAKRPKRGVVGLAAAFIGVPCELPSPPALPDGRSSSGRWSRSRSTRPHLLVGPTWLHFGLVWSGARRTWQQSNSTYTEKFTGL